MNNILGLVGIKNIGNTCYLNSILQCLFHSKKLIIELIYIKESIQQIDNGNIPLTKDFMELIQLVWFNNTYEMVPNIFKSILGKIDLNYNSMEQMDSHECLVQVLDIMTEELLKENLIDNINLEGIEKPTLIHNVFYGLFETTIVCENQHTNITLEPFVDISMPITNGDNLLQLINNFELPETLEDDNKYFCDHCNGLVNAQKQLMIKNLPNDIFIIHLKRFQTTNVGGSINIVKLEKMIDYPLQLNLKDKKYHLFGVVNHIGNPSFGHYYSYIKHINNKWYELNDSNISELDETKIVNNNAYILFYQVE